MKRSPCIAQLYRALFRWLAFKLAHALVKRGRETGLPGAVDYDLRPLLDLVALGTIADVRSPHRRNRVLVTAGLERASMTGLD